MNQLYRCETCGLPFATMVDLYIHRGHCSNVSFPTGSQPDVFTGLPPRADVLVPSGAGHPATKGQQFCESCQSSITGSVTNLRRHQRSIAHIAVVEATRAKSKPRLAGQSSGQPSAVRPAKDRQWECEVCQVSFDTPYALASHRKSLPYKEATNSRLPEAERPLSEGPLREICGPCRALKQCCTGKIPCGTCEYYRRHCYSQHLSERYTRTSDSGQLGTNDTLQSPTVEGTYTSETSTSFGNQTFTLVGRPTTSQALSPLQGPFPSQVFSSLGPPSTPQTFPSLEGPSTSQTLSSTAQNLFFYDSNYSPSLDESHRDTAAESDSILASRQQAQNFWDDVIRPDYAPPPNTSTAAEFNSIDLELYHQIRTGNGKWVEGIPFMNLSSIPLSRNVRDVPLGETKVSDEDSSDF
ncbi:hypothetical protein BDZ45DRAFT_795617 [Acephala macrosclerotiorum]|nr:hypothetical protein BDZ45DRAFT_795617 [Acephala macrosclerotiorum]